MKGMRKKAAAEVRAVDQSYARWKANIPVLYDWFTNHNLSWPSLCCRWGPRLEEAKYKSLQRLYLSERTDGTSPNTLVISNCEVVKPLVAAAANISKFNEVEHSPFVKKFKTIIHPGEVNRIRELPQNSNIIATHTDSPDVLIWDVKAQPDRHVARNAAESCPNLILIGHQANAEYALAMCPLEPLVLSGGKDKTVVLWSIHDHVSVLAEASSAKSPGVSLGSVSCRQSTKVGDGKNSHTSTVEPRNVFQGHKDTVGDVQFCPSSQQEFCSAGDDSCIILWDARVGTSPVSKVENAHNGDINSIDWNPYDSNLILTGSADSSVRIFDRRYLVTSGGVGSPIYKFKSHKAAVLCVQWCPNKRTVFGSCSEDGFLNIWDHMQVGRKGEHVTRRPPNDAPGLFFKHAGHRDKVVDFHWNASEPWTIVSASDECASATGGGTVQIWRMTDLLYRPEEEVLAELGKFKDHILSCSSKT